MTIRRKIAAGLGGVTLMLGVLGGAVAVGAASNHATTPAAIAQSSEPDGETADGPDATNVPAVQGTPDVQDVPEVGDTPDTADTAIGQGPQDSQDGTDGEVEDGPTDMPVTTAP